MIILINIKQHAVTAIKLQFEISLSTSKQILFQKHTPSLMPLIPVILIKFDTNVKRNTKLALLQLRINFPNYEFCFTIFDVVSFRMIFKNYVIDSQIVSLLVCRTNMWNSLTPTHHQHQHEWRIQTNTKSRMKWKFDIERCARKIGTTFFLFLL